MRIVISSGHWNNVNSGARGIIDEVTEARKVTDKVSEYLKQLGCTVYTFHDNTSTNQNQNLKRIVDYHNSKQRDLDISIHFNAHSKTDSPRGTEVFYYPNSKEGQEIAAKVSKAISDASGLRNRGAKGYSYYFTRETKEIAILIEVCFVDSEADVELYKKHFDNICRAIAESVTGKKLSDVKLATVTPTSTSTKQENKQNSEIDIDQEIFMPSNQALRNAVRGMLLRFEQYEPSPISQIWRWKFDNRQLTISDALAILYLANDRGFTK